MAAKRKTTKRKPANAKITIDPWDAPPLPLAEDALVWWKPVVVVLRERGRLSDVMPLSVWKFCQFLAQFLRATSALNANGQILDIRDDKGVLKKSIPDPAFTVQQKLFDQLRRLIAELGLESKPRGTKNSNPKTAKAKAGGKTSDTDREAMLRRALQGFGGDVAGSE